MVLGWLLQNFGGTQHWCKQHVCLACVGEVEGVTFTGHSLGYPGPCLLFTSDPKMGNTQ